MQKGTPAMCSLTAQLTSCVEQSRTQDKQRRLGRLELESQLHDVRQVILINCSLFHSDELWSGKHHMSKRICQVGGTTALVVAAECQAWKSLSEFVSTGFGLSLMNMLGS